MKKKPNDKTSCETKECFSVMRLFLNYFVGSVKITCLMALVIRLAMFVIAILLFMIFRLFWEMSEA